MKSGSTINSLVNKAIDGVRLNFGEICSLFSTDNILLLGKGAAEISKKKIKKPSIVTYIVDRNINYTNVCVSKCRFCAFYKNIGDEGSYILSYDQISQKIEETKKKGGIQILMQGGLHPDLAIDYYEELFLKIKSEFDIHIHALSPPEIKHISAISNITVDEVLQRLKKAGLDSIPGGGAEILDDSIRKLISPDKCSTAEWLDVMEKAHLIDLSTTATMMFGHKESPVNIVNHLINIRKLQDSTGGFTAFIPWSFQPGSTKMGGKGATAFEYLKVLSISRIALDNFSNIQASWVTQGDKIAQLALLFGANDMGSTMLEENVVRAAGVSYKMSEEKIRSLIFDLGLTAQRRNMYYENV